MFAPSMLYLPAKRHGRRCAESNCAGRERGALSITPAIQSQASSRCEAGVGGVAERGWGEKR